MNVYFSQLPAELQPPLKEIEPYLQFSIGGGTPVEVVKGAAPKVAVSGGKAVITYHKIPEFFRLLTQLPRLLAQEGVYEECPAHEDLCVMSDCSRNAVLNLASAKRMICYLALMGFTSFMLYTEDTYEMPEYPYFGYMRGRFTKAELKELDRYALQFGIELIPCMQVLAHLEGSLRWKEAFGSVTDIGNILLVGEEKTYALIETMIKTWRECFSSRRIHVGMDEAHLLGAGQYMDRNGYRPRFEILLEHLNRVVEICKRYDFKPMMWSDMFFRIAFHTYYVDEGEVPEDVIRKVPEDVALVYWDYYTAVENEKRFRHMLECHAKFPNPTYFAGGAWKWGSISPANTFSLHVNEMHLKVAKEKKLPMVIATCWGDNGAEASNFSVMAVLQQYAEYAYADGADRARLKQRFSETFGLEMDQFLLLDQPDLLSTVDPYEHPYGSCKYLLYNDPIGGLSDCMVQDSFSAEYRETAAKLHAVPENSFSHLFKAAAALCDVLEIKSTLSKRIRDFYAAGDTAALKQIASADIPAVLVRLDTYLALARKAWYYENKTFGFDVVETRVGGLKERLRSAQLTLSAYCAGELARIEQLEEPLLPMKKPLRRWNEMASGNLI